MSGWLFRTALGGRTELRRNLTLHRHGSDEDVHKERHERERARRQGDQTMRSFWRSEFKLDITKEQCKDTGMALVLILLLLTLLLERDFLLLGAIGIHVLNMTFPQMYRPAAVVWLGLSHLLGTIVSKAILSIVFFAVVTPVGLWRRVFCADSLRLKAFKTGGESVMQEQKHTFTGKDLEHPY